MARHSVTLELKTVRSGPRTYRYHVLRWFDPRTGRKRSETLGRADDRRHPAYVTKTDARKIRDARAAEFDARPGRRGGGPTLAGLVRQHADARAAAGTHPRTLERDAYAARLLIAYFGPAQRIDQIEVSAPGPRPDAAGFVDALFDGTLARRVSRQSRRPDAPPRWSQATARSHLRHVRALFRHAVRSGHCPASPFAELGVTTATPDTAWRFVDRRDFFRLYKAAPPGWRRVLTLARFAALARADVLALTWDRVDWDAREITVRREKTGVTQQVPIDDTLAKIMAPWRDEDRYRLYARDRRLVAPGSVSLENPGRDLARLCRRAGVEPYGKPLHTLRKSRITEWARQHPVHVVQVWAGHANVSTTLQFYSRTTPDDMQAGKGPAHARRRQRARSSPKNAPKFSQA